MKKIFLPILITFLFVACGKEERGGTVVTTSPSKEVKNLDVNNDWVYFSFVSGGVVSETSDWDIAFKGYVAKTKVSAVKTDSKVFDEVTQAPKDGYKTNEERYFFTPERGIAKETVSPVIYTGFHSDFWAFMEQNNLFTKAGLTTAEQEVMKTNLVNDNGWQTFSVNGFKFTQNNWVYIVKTTNKKSAKIQFTDYTNDKGKTRFLSFKYQLSDSN